MYTGGTPELQNVVVDVVCGWCITDLTARNPDFVKATEGGELIDQAGDAGIRRIRRCGGGEFYISRGGS